MWEGGEPCGEKWKTEVVLPTANGGSIRHEAQAALRPLDMWNHRQLGPPPRLSSLGPWLLGTGRRSCRYGPSLGEDREGGRELSRVRVASAPPPGVLGPAADLGLRL